jgi:hypothetical protein
VNSTQTHKVFKCKYCGKDIQFIKRDEITIPVDTTYFEAYDDDGRCHFVREYHKRNCRPKGGSIPRLMDSAKVELPNGRG